MRRFTMTLGAALAICAVWLPGQAQAQVISGMWVRPITVGVQPQPQPPIMYYNGNGGVNVFPQIAPSYAATIRTPIQVPGYITYQAIPPLVPPPPGVYTSSTYSSFGYAQPGVIINQRYYAPYYRP